jgi:hypothetical protein
MESTEKYTVSIEMEYSDVGRRESKMKDAPLFDTYQEAKSYMDTLPYRGQGGGYCITVVHMDDDEEEN